MRWCSCGLMERVQHLRAGSEVRAGGTVPLGLPPSRAGPVHPGTQLRGRWIERKEEDDTHAWVTARTTDDPVGDPHSTEQRH